MINGLLMLAMRRDTVWKSEKLDRLFLENVRFGIPFAFEQVEVMIRLLKANCKQVQHFLDLGCGNGILAAAILEHYPNATGTLVDFSNGMLSEAKKLLAKHSNLKFVNGDFSNKNWIHLVKKKSQDTRSIINPISENVSFSTRSFNCLIQVRCS